MSQTEHKLDRLIGRIAEDTPTLTRDEIRELLESRRTEAGPNDTLRTQRNSSRLTHKGVLIMSSAIIILSVAVLSYLADNSPIPQAQQVTQSTAESRTAELLSPSAAELSPDGKVTTEPSTTQSFVDSLKAKQKTHTPVNTYLYAPIDLPEARFAEFGLRRHSSGELILRFKATKLGFSDDSAIVTYPADSLELRAKLAPTYITDGTGRLLTIYKLLKIKNGQTEYFNLVDRDLGSLLNRSYYPVTSQSIWGLTCDSGTGRFTVNASAQVGIMRADTVLTGACATSIDDINASIRLILAGLLIRDSTVKANYGGEIGLARTFAMDYQPQLANSDPLQKQLKIAFDRIELDTTSALEKAKAKMSACHKLMNLTSDIPSKLRLEQLHRKLDYEAYLIHHQMEEDELSDLRQFVPVRIRQATKMRRDGKFDNGLIFWYPISPELLQLLPPITPGAETPSSFLTFEVTPNPANFYLVASYALSGPATVTATLHDLAGREYIRQQAQSQSGSDRVTLNLAGLNSGIYLLTLQQNKDRVSRRVFIQR